MVVVYGEPQYKKRPKFSSYNKFFRVYTPQETLDYENLVKYEYIQQCDKYYPEEELTIEIKAYFTIPKNTSKIKTQKMINGEIRPTKKPDIDNIAKVILDALNGVAYKDDTQIVELIIKKYYSDKPRIEFDIY